MDHMQITTDYTDTYPVTEHALIKRVNRKLARHDEKLHKSRSSRAILDLGIYYIRDYGHNLIVLDNVDLEGQARELGVLAPNERLAE